MSWDAQLCDASGEEIAWFNYTHNTNVMADVVLYPGTDTGVSVFDRVFNRDQPAWYARLDGADVASAVEFLDSLLCGLRADQRNLRRLDPPNGWGSFDSFVDVLTRMRQACDGAPAGSRWTVSG